MLKMALPLAALFVICWPTPHADAAPLLCEHRSAEHALKHGDTVDSDSRFHVLKGELPTCGAGNGSSNQETSRDTSSAPRRKDSFGFHCSWHGCG